MGDQLPNCRMIVKNYGILNIKGWKVALQGRLQSRRARSHRKRRRGCGRVAGRGRIRSGCRSGRDGGAACCLTIDFRSGRGRWDGNSHRDGGGGGGRRDGNSHRDGGGGGGRRDGNSHRDGGGGGGRRNGNTHRNRCKRAAAAGKLLSARRSARSSGGASSGGLVVGREEGGVGHYRVVGSERGGADADVDTGAFFGAGGVDGATWLVERTTLGDRRRERDGLGQRVGDRAGLCGRAGRRERDRVRRRGWRGLCLDGGLGSERWAHDTAEDGEQRKNVGVVVASHCEVEEKRMTSFG
ncbi:hypothetical protein PG996_013384 [Apiospora saccharicola]|uniref:Uncharacterized protein n=1 Tax=Apiospora saccharicola TaxID=335842 RepID=A0ABR1U5F1_9PEZI